MSLLTQEELEVIGYVAANLNKEDYTAMLHSMHKSVQDTEAIVQMHVAEKEAIERRGGRRAPWQVKRDAEAVADMLRTQEVYRLAVDYNPWKES